LKEENGRLVNQWSNNGPRTTNFSEGFNRTITHIFSMAHPALGHFIQVMRDELLRQSTQAQRIILGLVAIRTRDQDVIGAENRVINAKDLLRHFWEANNYVIEVEVSQIFLKQHILLFLATPPLFSPPGSKLFNCSSRSGRRTFRRERRSVFDTESL
jgi:hypothetical protein